MMPVDRFFRLIGAGLTSLAVVFGFSTDESCAEERPDILLILADDLAWADLGCYGHSWHRTPNLDRLASEGLLFTDAYAAAPICSASRASILSGKTPARLGFEFVTKSEPGRQDLQPGQSLRSPPFTLDLPLAEKTIAERLAGEGYRTAFFGKWHLNAHHGGYLGWSPTHGPKAQGFEIAIEDFGSHPYSYRGSERPPVVKESGVFPEDTLTSRAIEAFTSRDHRPLFLMVSHFFVHTPVETECEWLLADYEARVPDDVASRQRRIRYAAFVETLDHHVGRLLDAVDRFGSRDTLVVFTSDNGGHPEYTANAPLRGSKWNLYEGGIRVPMLVRWPGVVSSGEVCREPVIGYDLLPTFVEIAGDRNSSDDKIDGVSLLSLWKQPERALKRDLIWHFPYYHPENGYRSAIDEIGRNDFAISKTRPQSAIRRGPHKLLLFHERGDVELYNLAFRPGESKDISNARPAVSATLRRALREYLDRVDARLPKQR